MKKIKILTFLGILLCTFFIFNINFKANASEEKNIYEKIDLVYSENVYIYNAGFYDSFTYELSLVVKSDVFINNIYMNDIYDNVFLHLDYSDLGRIYSYTFSLITAEMIFYDELSFTVYISTEYFEFYWDEILGISENDFYQDFLDYFSNDLYKYFKLYVRADTTRRFDEEDNFAEKYGVNMVYKTLNFYDITNPTFNFTGNWWENGTDTYIFEYRPLEESLEELIRLWSELSPVFMKLYTPVSTLEYISNYNLIPTDSIGWTTYDGYVYLIIKQDYFDSSSPILPQLGDLVEVIRVDTWVVTESTPDYQLGYNTGYQQGYNSGHSTGYNKGYTEGWEAKEAEINALLPGIRQAEYQRGYDEGYDDGIIAGETVAYEKGYLDGANESFIATMDKWLVPAIIIVMLLGGYFAIARKKREGDI